MSAPVTLYQFQNWRRVAPLVSLFLVIAVVLMSRGGLGMGVMAVVCLASLLSSIAGFAFSAICGAMLFRLPVDPVHAVQIMIVCSIANQATMTWALRHEIDWRALLPYLAGGALGLPLGVWVLLHADRVVYTRAFGVFLLAYGLYMLLRRPMALRTQPVSGDLAAGFLGGITGGAAGFPGAFVTIWCSFKGWDKSRQRAVFQPFILLMQIISLLSISLAHGASGALVGFHPLDLLFIPAGLVGTAIGMALYRRLSDTQFARGVNLLMIASGLSYVV